MPNAAEMIDKNAREAERLRILLLAQECKDLPEFLEKLTALVKGE